MKKTPPVPDPSLRRLFDGMDAMKDDPEAVERAFMARHLISCTLPHSDPGGDVRQWARRNGDRSLRIIPDVHPDTGKSLYPYGTLPRLLLYWIVTEAARTKSRKLYLGHSLTSFIHQLKLNASSGGKRGVPRRLRDQMNRLLRAQISFEDRGDKDRDRFRLMHIGPEAELWWSRTGEQAELFESWIELGEKFYKAIVDGPVPVDRRALTMLKNSSLALDLYGWVVVKTWQANQNPEAFRLPVSWELLYGQMGSEYKEIRDFKKKVLKALSKVKLAYPKMKVEILDNGLLVKAAPTPVSEIE
jgi:hypothetical protein